MTPPRPRPLAGTVLGLVLGLGAAHGQQGNPGAADVHAVGAEVIADLDETSVTRSEPGAGLAGKWLKASGRWVEQRFEASRAEQRGPLKDTAGGRVTGQIDALGPEPRTFLSSTPSEPRLRSVSGHGGNPHVGAIDPAQRCLPAAPAKGAPETR